MVSSHESPIKGRPGEARQSLEVPRKLWPEPNAWPSFQGQYGRGGFLPRVARGGVSALLGGAETVLVSLLKAKRVDKSECKTV